MPADVLSLQPGLGLDTEHGFNCILTTPTTNLPSNNYQLKVTSSARVDSALALYCLLYTSDPYLTVTRKLVMGPNLWSDSNTQKQRTYTGSFSIFSKDFFS